MLNIITLFTMLLTSADKERLLEIYSNPANTGALRGVDQLYRQARSEGLLVTRKQVQNFLYSIPAYALHRKSSTVFPRRKIVAFSKFECLAADLMDLQKYKFSNKHFSFVLVVLDVLSKTLFLYPLKTKTGREIKNALKYIFTMRMGRDAEFIRRFYTDKG